MKLAVLFLILTGTLCAFGEEKKSDTSLAQRFFDYIKAVDSVMAAWENYINTPPSDQQQRQIALQEFLGEHNRTLALEFESFTSVLNGDITNPHLNLLQALLQSHRKDLAAATAAIDSAIETYRRASVIEINVIFLTKGDHNDAMEDLQVKIESTIAVAQKNAKIVIENYKKNGWKEHLDRDIQDIIQEKPASKGLLQELFNFLKVAYPFRTWLVANYRSNEVLPYRFCVESRPFIHRYYHNDEATELLVAHAELNRRFGASSEASLRLSRLTESDWHWRRCHRKAGDIYAELRYSCGTKRHGAVMVMPLAPNEFTFLTTDDGFVNQRTVRRHFPIICHQEYQALIFA